MPFHYVGVVTEFPTAPKDSFFVANASYVAAKTGSDAVGAFLIDTGGKQPAAVAARVQAAVGPAADRHRHRHRPQHVGSSLTAVDLAGLTRVELGFALVLAAAAGGLVLALGLAERRRNLAILTALGARRRQLGPSSPARPLVGVAGLIGGASSAPPGPDAGQGADRRLRPAAVGRSPSPGPTSPSAAGPRC